MLVVYFNLDTFEKETMPTQEYRMEELRTVYRVAALQNTVEHPFKSPCVIIQAKLKDEIHTIKLTGPSYKLAQAHSEQLSEDTKIKVERWMGNITAMLEERFSSDVSRVVWGTYYHHKDISGVPGVES